MVVGWSNVQCERFTCKVGWNFNGFTEPNAAVERSKRSIFPQGGQVDFHPSTVVEIGGSVQGVGTRNARIGFGHFGLHGFEIGFVLFLLIFHVGGHGFNFGHLSGKILHQFERFGAGPSLGYGSAPSCLDNSNGNGLVLKQFASKEISYGREVFHCFRSTHFPTIGNNCVNGAGCCVAVYNAQPQVHVVGVGYFFFAVVHFGPIAHHGHFHVRLARGNPNFAHGNTVKHHALIFGGNHH